ncbi:hypothetical protein ACS5PN_12325 [Roseateles sp. NT4]|uniref:AbiU2 domain-containing protein n=1 Tax=Roseateles sp. NT4 TaxID=3453715 RepID=UPI003EED61E6
MPTQIEKLEAHTSHLLDAFLGLKERYALLHPMLFDADVVKHHGSEKRARGFKTLRHSLFLSCAQDIAKLSLDKDDRTPSIRRLVGALQDEHLQAELRERFAIWVVPSVEEEADPEIREALRRMELREQAERRAQFDEILASANAKFLALESDAALLGFLTIRDRVSAHTEVHLVADKYQFVDIGQLGIKWADLKRIVDLMQSLVEELGMLIRNAGFAWESLESQLARASAGFWQTN